MGTTSEILAKMGECEAKLTALFRAIGLKVTIMAGVDHVAVFSGSEDDARASAASLARLMRGKASKVGRPKVTFNDEWMARIAITW